MYRIDRSSPKDNITVAWFVQLSDAAAYAILNGPRYIVIPDHDNVVAGDNNGHSEACDCPVCDEVVTGHDEGRREHLPDRFYFDSDVCTDHDHDA